jgi:hypothetical protein
MFKFLPILVHIPLIYYLLFWIRALCNLYPINNSKNVAIAQRPKANDHKTDIQIIPIIINLSSLIIKAKIKPKIVNRIKNSSI